MNAFRGLAGRLHFQPIGAPGTPYPAWFALGRGRNGVYVIRDIDTKEVLYVGESHSRRLDMTCRRHFAAWKSDARHDWHVILPRDRVEVALLFRKSGGVAISIQNGLIRELNPKMNSSVNGLSGEAIRAIRASSESSYVLAKRYGRDDSTIRRIRRRCIHRHT